MGLGSAADGTIWNRARRTGAIIITKDRDFEREDRIDPGPRVLLVCLGNCSNAYLFRRLQAALPDLVALFEQGRRIIEWE